MMVRKTFVVAALAASALPGIARAQAKCEIDDGKPGQVKDARNASGDNRGTKPRCPLGFATGEARALA